MHLRIEHKELEPFLCQDLALEYINDKIDAFVAKHGVFNVTGGQVITKVNLRGEPWMEVRAEFDASTWTGRK